MRNKFWFFLLICLSSIPGLKAQDFIPTIDIYPSSGHYIISGMPMFEREKLMTYHVIAIRRNGVSKEIHQLKGDDIRIFTYSKKGLLEQCTINDPLNGYVTEAIYQYDEMDRLISVSKYYSHSNGRQFTEFIRDPSGRITSIKCGTSEVIYKYSKGVLQQVGKIASIGGYFQKEKNTSNYTFFYSESSNSLDQYGRELGMGALEYSKIHYFDKDGRWTGAKVTREELGVPSSRKTSHFTISYKDGLMKSINDDGQITTIKYEYGHKSESNLKKSYKIR